MSKKNRYDMWGDDYTEEERELVFHHIKVLLVNRPGDAIALMEWVGVDEYNKLVEVKSILESEDRLTYTLNYGFVFTTIIGVMLVLHHEDIKNIFKAHFGRQWFYWWWWHKRKAFAWLDVLYHAHYGYMIGEKIVSNIPPEDVLRVLDDNT